MEGINTQGNIRIRDPASLLNNSSSHFGRHTSNLYKLPPSPRLLLWILYYSTSYNNTPASPLSSFPSRGRWEKLGGGGGRGGKR